MTVAELIELLQQYPSDMLVAYEMYSEQTLMYAGDIHLFKGCEPRQDGWIQNERPDKATQTYLLFPGN